MAHFPSDTCLTPVDTLEEGFPGATGVTKNEKTPCFTGFSTNWMLYEAAALTSELRRLKGWGIIATLLDSLISC
jgi:hypothetical protein